MPGRTEARWRMSCCAASRDRFSDSRAEWLAPQLRLARRPQRWHKVDQRGLCTSNHNGKLNALDASFKDLRIWGDANRDGKTDAGELKLLADYNIAELNLDVANGSTLDDGNLLILVLFYTKTDGSTHAITDVWFSKAVTPASSATTSVVSLGEVLAASSTNLLVDNAALAKLTANTAKRSTCRSTAR